MRLVALRACQVRIAQEAHLTRDRLEHHVRCCAVGDERRDAAPRRELTTTTATSRITISATHSPESREVEQSFGSSTPAPGSSPRAR
jgi:hypothetical protein